MSDINQILHH